MGQIVGYVMSAVVVDGDCAFSLAELCRASGLERTQIVELVAHGVLDPQGTAPDNWTFGGPALRTARAAGRLMRDLELDAAGVAMALDLIQEIAALRRQLRRGGAH